MQINVFLHILHLLDTFFFETLWFHRVRDVNFIYRCKQSFTRFRELWDISAKIWFKSHSSLSRLKIKVTLFRPKGFISLNGTLMLNISSSSSLWMRIVQLCTKHSGLEQRNPLEVDVLAGGRLRSFPTSGSPTMMFSGGPRTLVAASSVWASLRGFTPWLVSTAGNINQSRGNLTRLTSQKLPGVGDSRTGALQLLHGQRPTVS